MAYNTTTGIITAPVSIRDVQQCLGTSIDTLAPANNNGVTYDLCGHPSINIWSKMKPARYNSLDVVVIADWNIIAGEDRNVVLANQVRTPITYGTLGVIFPKMMPLSEWGRLPKVDEEYDREYHHDYPTGKSGNNNYASRLRDFNGYSHKQEPPFGEMTVSWSGRSFTCTIPLAWDGVYGILPTWFDGTIYQNVIWSPAVLVFGDIVPHVVRIEDAASKSRYLMLRSLTPSTDELVFTGEVNAVKEYTFVPFLIGYKFYTDGEPAFEEHMVYIHATAISDSEECGIPMPSPIVKSTSKPTPPSIFIKVYSPESYPDMSDGVWGLGEKYVIIETTYNGGEEGFAFTGIRVECKIEGDDDSLKPLSASDVIVGSNRLMTKRYVRRTEVFGEREVYVSVTCDQSYKAWFNGKIQIFIIA